MLTKEQIQRYHEITERVEAEAEAEDRALMRKLVQEYKQRSRAGMPATTMPLSNNAQDTSQTPSDGE